MPRASGSERSSFPRLAARRKHVWQDRTWLWARGWPKAENGCKIALTTPRKPGRSQLCNGEKSNSSMTQ
eukprot:12902966-Prorocentrum_lima.AAC.1